MTSEYTVEQLKDMLYEAQLEEQEAYIRHRERKEQQVKDAIDQRGIPELHDIWKGRKTANMSDIVLAHDPNEGLPKHMWKREYKYTFTDFLLLTNQMMIHSNAYIVMIGLFWYLSIW